MHMVTHTFANTANIRMATKGREESCRVTAGSSFCERHMTDKHECTHVEELGVPFTFFPLLLVEDQLRVLLDWLLVNDDWN